LETVWSGANVAPPSVERVATIAAGPLSGRSEASTTSEPSGRTTGMAPTSSRATETGGCHVAPPSVETWLTTWCLASSV
jgi:hypothetical protein